LSLYNILSESIHPDTRRSRFLVEQHEPDSEELTAWSRIRKDRKTDRFAGRFGDALS